MYKIPLTFDGTKLHGKIVGQICFTLNTISIHFGLDCYLQIEGAFELSNKEGVFYTENLYPVSTDLRLLKFLEKSIAHVGINELRNNLSVVFEDKSVLTLIGNDHYESYRIKIGDIEILV